ncbi:tetratricopeptide repeat protein [Leptolyngbya sp. NK1-12]|uniref:Tetratricopeptide repeat protein n=1 Tax=Leptolyngbya sp. NK1-12 TaxID=2547451 RepID=A0AA96WE10_9CYAN|nr:tetratricopeptide repeat protein [Leptolyngbya sp. NK1-12]
MVLCSLQVDSSSASSGSSVTENPFRNILGLNQQTYERLKVALSLNLRRQIFIAVCDDLPLRDRFAIQLQSELAHISTSPPSAGLPTSSLPAVEPRAFPRLVTLDLDLHNPDPIGQVNEWLSYFPAIRTNHQAFIPAFQILGIERLIRQSAALQNVFLSYLQNIEQQLPSLNSCLLLWMTQPWFRMLPEAAPEFWDCRTGVFEFIGDPTPLPASLPERIQFNPGSASFRELPSPPPIDRTDRTDHRPDEQPDVNSGDDSDNQPNSESTSIQPAENPWIPLAEDLTLYESEEPGDSTSLWKLPDELPPDFQQWIAAWSHNLGQHLSEADPNSLTASQCDAATEPTHETRYAQSLLVATQPAQSNLEQSSSALALEKIGEIGADPSLLEAALSDLLTQDPAKHAPLLQHISLLQQQLDLLQQGEGTPLVLATAYQTLGNFYRDCIEQGDASAENLAVAIQAYEQALQLLPETGIERAELLNDLGSLYWIMAQNQANPEATRLYLEQTVQIYQLALNPLQPQAHSQTYAMVQNNLGAAYADLARYQEAVINLQLSVEAYQQALLYRPAEVDPWRYASTQNNLGTTYWNLAQHQQPEFNLKQAIQSYGQALCHYNPDQEPLTYAMIQNNLGTAYWNLAQYEQAQDYLHQAIAAYRSALQYRSLDSTPAGFAATQNNLGTAYWHLANQTSLGSQRITYLQQAITAYEAALKAADQIQNHEATTALNFDLSSTQNNLGLAHYQIAVDCHANPTLAADAAEQTHHLTAALQQHLLALQGWEQNENLRQTALSCLLQTVRACYNQLGLAGQNQALSQIPSYLLSEILPRL